MSELESGNTSGKLGGKGQRVSLITVAMLLITQGQQMLSAGEKVIGAGLIALGGVLLLGYEFINEVDFKGR